MTSSRSQVAAGPVGGVHCCRTRRRCGGGCAIPPRRLRFSQRYVCTKAVPAAQAAASEIKTKRSPPSSGRVIANIRVIRNNATALATSVAFTCRLTPPCRLRDVTVATPSSTLPAEPKWRNEQHRGASQRDCRPLLPLKSAARSIRGAVQERAGPSRSRTRQPNPT